MSKLIDKFQADCDAAGLSPPKVLQAAGLNRSLWYRWRDGNLPSVRSLERVMEKLDELMPRAELELWSPSDTDLRNKDNRVQARHELDRAISDDALARWARKWGRPAIEHASLSDSQHPFGSNR